MTALPIGENYYPKLGEVLCKTLGPAILSQVLSQVWGNQCPNSEVDVTLCPPYESHSHNCTTGVWGRSLGARYAPVSFDRGITVAL